MQPAADHVRPPAFTTIGGLRTAMGPVPGSAGVELHVLGRRDRLQVSGVIVGLDYRPPPRSGVVLNASLQPDEEALLVRQLRLGLAGLPDELPLVVHLIAPDRRSPVPLILATAIQARGISGSGVVVDQLVLRARHRRGWRRR